ncbi:hypothetical protein PINS_up012817 [Pythium insidiosum]|nr:hypothetical protein PINS_up012817 [Pythium insidiosum]
MEFSPLPEQKTSASETPAPRSTTFFEDEAQYRVLQTPATVIRQEMNAQRSSKRGEEGGEEDQEPVAQRLWSGYRSGRSGETMYTRWRDLHQRCVETTQFCEARLRERELKLQRFHIPACKLKHKTPRGMALEQRLRPQESLQTPQASNVQSSRQDCWETPASSRRREPLTPVIATRLSFGSVDLSPIVPNTQEKKRLKDRARGAFASAVLDASGQEPTAGGLLIDSVVPLLHRTDV